MATGNPFIDGLMSGDQFATDLLNAKANRQLLADQQKMADFKAQNPMLSMPGMAGQLGAIDYYGASSPEGQTLQNYINLQNAATLARMNYQNQLAGSIGLRFMPSGAKNQTYNAMQNLGYTAPQIGNMNDAQRSNIDTNQIQSPNTQLAQQAKNEANQTQSIIDKQTMASTSQQQLPKINTAMSLYNEMLPDLYNASQYAGIPGKIKLQADKLTSMTGYNPPAYQSFINYQQKAQLFVNEVNKALAGQATDQQTKEMKMVIDPSLAQNPQQFRDAFNSLSSVLQNQKQNLSKNLAQQVQSNPLNSINPGNTSSSSIPKSFNNQQEFEQWYSSLSPAQRQQYQQSIGQ